MGELLIAQFKINNKNVNPELLTLIQRHCRSAATSTPLFVTVLASFIAWKSVFEPEIEGAVGRLLEGSADCVQLMKHVLMTIEEEYDGRIFPTGTLKHVLLLIFASRCGLAETEIFRVLGERSEVDTSSLSWHCWSVVVEILISTRMLRHRGGVVVFAGPLAREVVRQLYLPDNETLKEYRRTLIAYHLKNLDHGFSRTVDELLWLLLQLGDREQLKKCLGHLDVFVNLFSQGRTNELLRFWGVTSDDKTNAISSAYLDALKVASDAADMGVDGIGNDSGGMTLTRVAAIYEALSRFFRDMSCFPLALRPLQRALELREALDPDNAEVGRTIFQLAQLNADWHKYPTAEALFKNALEMFEGLFGSEHFEVGTTLEALGVLYRHQGKHDIARPLQRRADSIKWKWRQREREEISKDVDIRRTLDTGLEKPPETPVSLASATPANFSPRRRSIDGKNIAGSLFNYGIKLCQQEKHANALPLFQGALTIFESSMGQSHPLVAKTLRKIALVKYHLGDYESAATFYKKAIEIKEEDGVDENFTRKPSVKSRRSSSDTMSTVKVGDDTLSYTRAASTQ